MKIRNGFVSNSSSSSFMISVPSRGGISKSSIINRFKKAYQAEYESVEKLDKEILDFINKEFDRGYEVFYVRVDNEMCEDEVVEKVIDTIGGKCEYIEM